MADTATPGIVKTNPAENIYILAVKEGNFVNNYNVTATDLQDAITKCKKYCEIAGTKRRFIHVRPFLTDLERKHEADLKTT